ncbi:MAG TPA: hypothetical protein VMY42_12165 [Thermoguttaceae bacterium]|nr:hypothetical protein [Thermoguttaceae bacterium]
MFLTGQTILIAVLSGISAWALIKLGVAIVNRVQKWSRDLSNVGFALSNVALPKLADITALVASRDLGGAIAELHILSKQLREGDPEKIVLEWTKKHFVKVLPERLKDPEILALVQEAVAAQLAKK